MKSLLEFLNESKKETQEKKVLKDTFDKKYKVKDSKLKKKLQAVFDKFMKKNKDKLTEGKEKIADKYKKGILEAIGDWVQNQIDDWKSYWEEKEDMERDLENINDWFWNEIDENIDDIPFEDYLELPEGVNELPFDSKDILDYLNEISNEIDSVISDLAYETESYMYDAREWDDDDDHYGDDDDDDDDDRW